MSGSTLEAAQGVGDRRRSWSNLGVIQEAMERNGVATGWNFRIEEFLKLEAVLGWAAVAK